MNLTKIRCSNHISKLINKERKQNNDHLLLKNKTELLMAQLEREREETEGGERERREREREEKKEETDEERDEREREREPQTAAGIYIPSLVSIQSSPNYL